MRMIFHGNLRMMFGPSVVMQADTVADALEGFSRQVDWPRDTLVHVVGFDTREKLYDFAEEIHIMPAMHGGGGKFGQIILGAVVVGLAFALGPGSAFFVPLLVSGGLMILQGVIGLFLKSPTMKSVNDPDASKYLPVNKNTTAVGTPIVMAWGRIDLAGQWLSLQSDSTNISYGVFPSNPM